MRISFEEYMGKICLATAQRSTCPKAKVGSALVSKYGEIKSNGCNGAAKGWPHCLDVGC